MQSFYIALNAVFPFLCYILFGYGINLTGLTNETFLKKLNQMVFKAFFPIMMFYNLYTKDDSIEVSAKLIAFSVLSLTAVLLLAIILVPKFVGERKKQGTIIQAIYRSNTVLFAIPLMNSIYGKAGTAFATVLIAIMVPIYNVIAVLVLEYYGSDGKNTDFVHILKSIATNPIIDGALVGILFHSLKIPLPEQLLGPVSEFAAMTTPLALFILGGTLKFKSLFGHLKYIIPSMIIKLFIIPFIIIIISTMLGLSHSETFVMFCLYGTPVAASSYTMAESMGCDGPLAGEFVVFSTTISVLTIFTWIFILNQLHMI